MTLRFGVIGGAGPPGLTSCGLDPVCEKRGYLIDAATLACQYLRINCTFELVNHTNYGDADLHTGRATGMINSIHRGDYDSALPIFTPTYRRSTAITFSKICDSTDLVAMTRAPEPVRATSWSILYAFDWRVWTALAVSWVIVATILECTVSVKESQSIRTVIFGGISRMINTEHQGKGLKRDSARLLMSVWLLITLIASTSYTGILFSKNLSSTQKFPFVNLETLVECLEKNQCQLISYSTTLSYLQQLISVNTSIGFKLQKVLDENPIMIVPADEIAAKVINERGKYLVSIGAKNVRLSWIQGNRGCRYYFVNLGYSEIYTFPAAKNSTHLGNLNRVAAILFEHGLSNALKRKYSSTSLCDEQWESGIPFDHGNTLKSMIATFVVYGLGCCVSCCAFGMETWLRRVRSKGNVEKIDL